MRDGAQSLGWGYSLRQEMVLTGLSEEGGKAMGKLLKETVKNYNMMQEKVFDSFYPDKEGL